MAAKRKKQALTIYSDAFKTLKTSLPVEVDEAGEGWLTPDQIDMLEAAHRSAAPSPKSSDAIEVVRNLVMHSRVPRKPVAISAQVSSQIVTLSTPGAKDGQLRS